MDKDLEVKKQSIWSRWFSAYVVAGAVFYYGSKFVKSFPVKTLSDDLIVSVAAITGGVLYFKLKQRIVLVKNNTINNIIIAIVLVIISMFFIGFFTNVF